MNHGSSLTSRFLAAQVLVVMISLLVAATMATMVGPTLFHDHMLMAGREDPSLELFHAEQAYRDANLITLAVALPTALISARIEFSPISASAMPSVWSAAGTSC